MILCTYNVHAFLAVAKQLRLNLLVDFCHPMSAYFMSKNYLMLLTFIILYFWQCPNNLQFKIAGCYIASDPCERIHRKWFSDVGSR